MLSFMARPLRIEYSGAVYDVMARGDGGKFIFNDDSDALLFLKRAKGVSNCLSEKRSGE